LLVAASLFCFSGSSEAAAPSPATTVVRSAGGLGLGSTIDLIAERAFLTGFDSGTEVRIPASGQQVVAHLEWRVDGAGAPVEVSVRALLDGAVVCSTTSEVVPGSQATTFCSESQTIATGGHILRWELDFTGTIQETREGNNAIRHIWRTGGGVDLVAQRAFLRTGRGSGDELPAPNPGETVYFHVSWRAVGFPVGADVTLRSRIDGNDFCAGSIEPQPTFMTTWCSEAWQVTAAPSHTLEWELDPNDEIAETNELNNVVDHTWLLDVSSTPTRTATRIATQTPPPSPTRTRTVGGEFPPGDADCSLSVGANDLLLAVLGVSIEGCDNADCDRDGDVDRDDVECAIGCLFGQCPIAP